MSRVVQPGRNTLATSGLSLEVVDVELTTMPLIAFFKIAVKSRESLSISHNVMKCNADILELHDAIVRELAGSDLALRGAAVYDWVADSLPQPPPPRSEPELASIGFRRELNSYLSMMSLHAGACSTYALMNFFQLSDEYADRTEVPQQGAVEPPLKYAPACDLRNDFAYAKKIIELPSSCSGSISDMHVVPRVRLASHEVGHPQQVSMDLLTSAGQYQPTSRRYVPSSGQEFTTKMKQASNLAVSTSSPSQKAPFLHDSQGKGASKNDVMKSDTRRIGVPHANALRVVRTHTPHTEPLAGYSRSSGSSASATSDALLVSSLPVTAGQLPGNRKADGMNIGETNLCRSGRFKDEISTSHAEWASLSPDGSSFSSFGSDQAVNASSSTPKSKRPGYRRPWCVICMASPQEMAIDPCGHMSMCESCCIKVAMCPVCRGPINKALRVFIT